jgi:hypothetical protein
MPKTHGIFYEAQSGGLCRLHAINAFFGESAFTPTEFSEYVTDFDRQMERRYGETTSCSKFDLVHADQNNVVGFILKKNGHYVRYIPTNYFHGKKPEIDDLHGDFIFAYNDGHIWGIRRAGDVWYKVDSIGGVTRIGSIINYLAQPNMGFLIPVKMRQELYFHVDAIIEIFRRENVKTRKGVLEYLKKLKKRKQILEDLEVHMGVAVDILDAQANSCEWRKEFIPIYNLVSLFQQFMIDFVDQKYSINILEAYVPEIVFSLLILVRGRDAITGKKDDSNEFIR